MVVIDDVSYEVMQGSTIDHEEEIARRGFTVSCATEPRLRRPFYLCVLQVVDNPFSDTSCGCGVSFSIKM